MFKGDKEIDLTLSSGLTLENISPTAIILKNFIDKYIKDVNSAKYLIEYNSILNALPTNKTYSGWQLINGLEDYYYYINNLYWSHKLTERNSNADIIYSNDISFLKNKTKIKSEISNSSKYNITIEYDYDSDKIKITATKV